MGRKVVIFSTIFLIFSCLSCVCFASTNYTIINESLNNLGYSSIEENSNTTSVLNRKYIFSLFYNFNENGEPQNLYIAGLDFDGYEPVIYAKNYNDASCYYYLSANRFSPASSTVFYGVVYDINSDKSLSYNNSISSGNVKLLEYSNYSASYSLDEFKNPNFVKKIFIDNIVYSQFNSLYSYNGSFSSNLLYKFDGVFKGNGTQEPYTSNFVSNSNMFRFEYTAYTDLTNSNVVNYFFLQEFTPSQAINLNDEDLNFNDSDEQISMNTKLESNFSYTSLIRRMQQGYIYRLYCFSNQQNQSGDLIRTTDSTSCFFSLNSWKSNAITVLNIYDIMFPENPDIEQEGGTSGGVIDLENIQNGITDLNNNLTAVPTLSGESITSSEITDALDFEFTEDPYANFWLELTTGLSGALTNNVRSIDVQFRNKIYKIELDKFAIQAPEFLRSFLAILSTVFIFWKMIKYWKIIIDNITSGNMDEVLEMNEEERHY